MVHVALVPSQHPAARIVDIDAAAALAMPGVHAVVTGAELAAAVDPMMNGLDTPNVRRFPLAVGQVRYNGEWVAAVAADSRAPAEDAAELIAVSYERASLRARRRGGAEAGQSRRCIRITDPMCCSTAPSCGAMSPNILRKARTSSLFA